MFEDVLIADDDPVSRRLLQVSLGNAGYRVVTAADGVEALVNSMSEIVRAWPCWIG